MGYRKLEGSEAVGVQQDLVLANELCALVFCDSSKLWPLNSYIAARVSTHLTAVSSKVRSSAAPIGTLPTKPRSASSMLLTCWFSCNLGSAVLRPPERCREELVENLNCGIGPWPGAGRIRCLHMLCFQRNCCEMLSPGLSAHGAAVGAFPRGAESTRQIAAAVGG